MTEKEGFDLSNTFRQLVQARTGLSLRDLVCPREKSDMTPCVARDGELATAFVDEHPICVGCEASVETLIAAEREKA